MKKIIALILACTLMLTLFGCVDSVHPAPEDIAPEDVPASLMEFLGTFTDWYQGDKYDCTAPEDCLLLTSVIANGSCVNWSAYPGPEPEYHWDDGTTDPKNWCEQTGGSYYEFSKELVDNIVKNVFNLTDEQLAKQIEIEASTESFYEEDGKYYCMVWGVGDPFTTYKVVSAQYDGSKYYLFYDCYFDFGDPETMELAANYYAEAGLKKDGDNEYWSLYKMERLEAAG